MPKVIFTFTSGMCKACATIVLINFDCHSPNHQHKLKTHEKFLCLYCDTIRSEEGPPLANVSKKEASGGKWKNFPKKRGGGNWGVSIWFKCSSLFQIKLREPRTGGSEIQFTAHSYCARLLIASHVCQSNICN